MRKEKKEMICFLLNKKGDNKQFYMLFFVGGSDFEWVMQPAMNTMEGLLCVWSKEFFELSYFFIGNDYLGLVGIWKE